MFVKLLQIIQSYDVFRRHLYHHPQFLYKLRMRRLDVNRGSPSSQVSLMIIYRTVIFCWLGKEGFNILMDR